MSESAPELRALCQRVQQWRQDSGGGRGTAVPQQIWQEARQVAQVVGVYATARATRLNYRALKERVEAASVGAAPRASRRRSGRAALVPPLRRTQVLPPGESSPGAPGRFVELAVSPRPSGPSASLEVVGRGGERMRVEVSGGLDLVAVLQAFLGRAS